MNNESINFIIGQFTTLAKAVVSALRGNKYAVDVKNFPRQQEIKGTVIVGNQKNLEAETKRLNQTITKGLADLTKELKPLPQKNFPTEFKVTNPDAFPKTLIKIPETIKVNNFTEVTKELNKLGNLLKDSISKLKLDPQINVASPKVEVKAPDVIINEREMDLETPLADQTKALEKAIEKLTETLQGKDPENYISARLTDGKKFYNALEELFLTGGVSNRNAVYKDSNGNRSAGQTDGALRVLVSNEERWQINHTSTDSGTSYLGMQDVDGKWQIQKKVIAGSSVITSVQTYASNKNNSTINDYGYAWAHRVTITYGLYVEAMPV